MSRRRISKRMNERSSNMSRYKVILQQGENIIKFAFNEYKDAQEFILTCMECADKGTMVTFYEEAE